jgi:hypothetical protein
MARNCLIDGVETARATVLPPSAGLVLVLSPPGHTDLRPLVVHDAHAGADAVAALSML